MQPNALCASLAFYLIFFSVEEETKSVAFVLFNEKNNTFLVELIKRGCKIKHFNRPLFFRPPVHINDSIIVTAIHSRVSGEPLFYLRYH